MVMIRHVLKNGTSVDNIDGHVIKAETFPVLYEVINRIVKEGETKKHESV